METATNGKVLLRVRPRGFCAGVVRAVDIVELALEAYGAPVYVHHEIVHNTYVVEQLRRRGAIFVESIDAVPHGAVLVFSAHGVPPTVRDEAKARSLKVIDATCPLVTKVHHAILDGVSGASMLGAFLDLSPRARVVALSPPWDPAPLPGNAQLMRYAMSAMAHQPGAALATIGAGLEALADLGMHTRDLTGRGELPPRPHSP